MGGWRLKPRLEGGSRRHQDRLRGLGLQGLRAARVALLVISAVEGALIMSRARRDMDALDAAAAEIDLLLAAGT